MSEDHTDTRDIPEGFKKLINSLPLYNPKPYKNWAAKATFFNGEKVTFTVGGRDEHEAGMRAREMCEAMYQDATHIALTQQQETQ